MGNRFEPIPPEEIRPEEIPPEEIPPEDQGSPPLASFVQQLKSESERLGFPLHGVCAAEATPEWERLQEWLQRGYAGEMHYLPNRLEAYRHPGSVLEGVRSILMLGMPYYPLADRGQRDDASHGTAGLAGLQEQAPYELAAEGQANVSCYAWGSTDYHDLIHSRLKSLRSFVLERHPEARVRGVVDSAPLMERQFAERAGLGWRGKNTLLLNRTWGSWFFLAALLTDLPLQADSAFESDHCGTCRACLDACPTQAFPEPYVLDATRCISYLTIEKRGELAEAERQDVGQWLFGCDICQDVCPWNRRVPGTTESSFAPRSDMRPVELAGLFELSDEAFRARFRRTPLWRSKRQGILRNAAHVLGNQRDGRFIPALQRGLEDPDAVIRDASAWALGQIGGSLAIELLQSAWDAETDRGLREKLASYVGTAQASRR